jgi:hypothetical protein
LGDIQVAVAVDLQAVRANPPAVDFVLGENVEQREVGAVAERAVGIDRVFQDAVADGFADVERLLVGGNANAVGVAIADAGH